MSAKSKKRERPTEQSVDQDVGPKPAKKGPMDPEEMKLLKFFAVNPLFITSSAKIAKATKANPFPNKLDVLDTSSSAIASHIHVIQKFARYTANELLTNMSSKAEASAYQAALQAMASFWRSQAPRNPARTPFPYRSDPKFVLKVPYAVELYNLVTYYGGLIASEKIIHLLAYDLKCYLTDIVAKLMAVARASAILPAKVPLELLRTILSSKEEALLDLHIIETEAVKTYRTFQNVDTVDDGEGCDFEEPEANAEVCGVIEDSTSQDTAMNTACPEIARSVASKWNIDRAIKRKQKYQHRLAAATGGSSLTPAEYVSFVYIASRTIRTSVDTQGRQFLRDHCELDESVLWVTAKVLKALFSLATERIRTIVRRACEHSQTRKDNPNMEAFDGFPLILLKDISFALQVKPARTASAETQHAR